MMKSLQPHILRSLIALFTVALASCGFWKNNPIPLSNTTQPKPPIQISQEVPKSTTPLNQQVTRTWEFDVDPALTSGTIDLAMDPKGAVLGTRTARDAAAIRGKIIVKVIEDSSSGNRRMSIQDIRLTNTEAYHMDFSWGALVGSITVDIPAKVLRIIPNSMKQQCIIEPNKSFSLPQCYFTVLGHSHTRGHGLVLNKAVGNKKVDLTMKKTEQVSLRGTIKEANGIATLHIPRAVLRDHFDLDGTRLDLVFTADITATAKIR